VDARALERLTKGELPSPCFVLDEDALLANAALLNKVQERSGAKILLALKGFAMWNVFPLLSRARGSGPLWGCCASSPHEARLAREEFGGETHVFAAAFSDEDMRDILRYADHVVFNSFAQWRHFKSMVQGCGRPLACGIRVNPEHSEGAVAMYNPCAPGSRLGVRREHFEADGLEGISGLHFHTLCEQGADALERTLSVFEKHFGPYLHGMQWVNFGGGHHITRQGYDVDLLCACIERISAKYKVQAIWSPAKRSPWMRAGSSARCWTWWKRICLWPFWTVPQPAICRMCWKCRIVRTSSGAACPEKRRITAGLPESPAWPGM